MSAPAGLTIAEARDRLRAGDIGAVELAEACLAAADGSGPLNAFSALTPDLARKQATLAQARLKEGAAPDLCGVPLGIKDLFCVEGVDLEGGKAGELVLPDDAPLATEFRGDLLGGVQVIAGTAANGKPFTAIPYPAWAHRGKGEMAVWLRREAE